MSGVSKKKITSMDKANKKAAKKAAEKLVSEGQKLSEAEDYVKARAKFADALTISPDNATVLYNMAMLNARLLDSFLEDSSSVNAINTLAETMSILMAIIRNDTSRRGETTGFAQRLLAHLLVEHKALAMQHIPPNKNHTPYSGTSEQHMHQAIEGLFLASIGILGSSQELDKFKLEYAEYLGTQFHTLYNNNRSSSGSSRNSNNGSDSSGVEDANLCLKKCLYISNVIDSVFQSAFSSGIDAQALELQLEVLEETLEYVYSGGISGMSCTGSCSTELEGECVKCENLFAYIPEGGADHIPSEFVVGKWTQQLLLQQTATQARGQGAAAAAAGRGGIGGIATALQQQQQQQVSDLYENIICVLQTSQRVCKTALALLSSNEFIALSVCNLLILTQQFAASIGNLALFSAASHQLSDAIDLLSSNLSTGYGRSSTAAAAIAVDMPNRVSAVGAAADMCSLDMGCVSLVSTIADVFHSMARRLPVVYNSSNTTTTTTNNSSSNNSNTTIPATDSTTATGGVGGGGLSAMVLITLQQSSATLEQAMSRCVHLVSSLTASHPTVSYHLSHWQSECPVDCFAWSAEALFIPISLTKVYSTASGFATAAAAAADTDTNALSTAAAAAVAGVSQPSMVTATSPMCLNAHLCNKLSMSCYCVALSVWLTIAIGAPTCSNGSGSGSSTRMSSDVSCGSGGGGDTAAVFTAAVAATATHHQLLASCSSVAATCAITTNCKADKEQLNDDDDDDEGEDRQDYLQEIHDVIYNFACLNWQLGNAVSCYSSLLKCLSIENALCQRDVAGASATATSVTTFANNSNNSNNNRSFAASQLRLDILNDKEMVGFQSSAMFTKLMSI